MLSLGAGAGAGCNLGDACRYITLFLTTAVTHPLDTLRVRLSVHADSARMGFFGSAKELLSQEGMSAYYRGFGATLIGAGPRGALGFGIFETLKPACKRIQVLKDNPAMSKVSEPRSFRMLPTWGGDDTLAAEAEST